MTIFFAAALLSAAGAAPADVAGWAAAYDRPVLAAPADAAGRQLGWGHLTLTFSSGRLHPVMVGGQAAGIYFSGAGRLRYVSADPAEAPIYRRNAEKVSDYRVGADGAVEDSISEALVMLSSGVPAGLRGEGTAAPEATRALDQHLERWRQDWTPHYRQLMAQARLDAPAQPLVIAEIQAGRHDIFYSYDSLRTGEESIGVVRRVKTTWWMMDLTGDRRVLERLGRQPIGRSWLSPPRAEPWVLRQLEATAINPRANRLEVETHETIEARAPLRVLQLSLATAFLGDPDAGPGKAWLPYALESVTDAGGRPLPFARGQDEVLVQLPAVLGAGQKTDVAFRMAGDVLHRPGGDNYWPVFENWYAAGPRPQMEAFSYHAVVKVAKPFTAFTSGSTVRRWEEGTLACAEFRETKPISGPIPILAGKYTSYTDARGGLTVRVSSYAMSKPRASKQIADLVHMFAAFYEPLLGPFPFPELDVVEVNSYGFGIAPPGMIFITKEAFNPLSTELTQAYVKGVNARLAHEVAHGWWAHVARPASIGDRWLGESMAEYYSALAMQLRRKDDYDHMVGEWKDQAKRVRGWGSVLLFHHIEGPDAYEDQSALLYAKGPLVLRALRRELGDDVFFTVFKSLLRSFPMKDVSTRDVVGLTNFITKKDYAPWFERYMLGSEWPPEKPD